MNILKLFLVTLFCSMSNPQWSLSQDRDIDANQVRRSSQNEGQDIETLLHFWVGKWDCYSSKGGPVNGFNDLTARMNGKVVHELWTPADGRPGGESWNYFDPVSRTWRQHWIDASGRPFVFVGTKKENGILYEGPHLDGKATKFKRRMFIRPIGNGRVQQTGTKSNDGGKTWQTEYDLVYVPRGEPFTKGANVPKQKAEKGFDFLIGDWRMDVEEYDPQGKQIRTLTDWSRVRKMIGGASLLDEWGDEGFTVRTWDPNKKVWRLFWTDRDFLAGNMQIWEGTFENGVGTFVGGYSVPDNISRSKSKIEFSEIKDNSVLWKMWKSPDNGETWVLQYIRRYKRVDSVADKMVGLANPANIKPIQQQALQLLKQQNFEQASVLYRKIVQAQPKNNVALFRLGYCLHATKKLDQAMNVYKKVIPGGGKPAILASYNLACIYSIQKKNDQAFAAIKQAINLGFKDPNQLATDPDFQNIKSDDRFKKMIESIGGND